MYKYDKRKETDNEGFSSAGKNGIQLKDNRAGTVAQRQVNNTGLPDKLKTGMENVSGISLDHVKVHYNSSKPAALQAHAYAKGSEIHLGSGQEKHLPHELGHVVQQAQGRVKATTSVNGVAVNDNKGLEKEADLLGERALKSGGTPVQQKKNLSIPQINMPQAPLQGAFIFKDWTDYDTKKPMPNHKMSLKEVAENIGGARVVQSIIKEEGKTFFMEYLGAFDGMVFENREQLINRLTSDRKSKYTILERLNFIKRIGVPGLDLVDHFLSGFESVECKYKLSLMTASGKGGAVHDLLVHLKSVLPRLGKTIAPAGVIDMLEKSFRTTWPELPVAYLKGGGDHEVLTGFYTTVYGVSAELETLVGASDAGPEPGEAVFSGAKYSEQDTFKKKYEEDVDVSFIDSDGVLNLIETGYSVNALKNKLTGPKLKIGAEPDGQKQRYQHLTRSSKVTQKPVGPLVGSMAKDRPVRGIRLLYSLPVKAFHEKIYSVDGLTVVSDLIKMDAGLMVGSKRYNPKEMLALKVDIGHRLDSYRKELLGLKQKLELAKLHEREFGDTDNDPWASDTEYISVTDSRRMKELESLLGE